MALEFAGMPRQFELRGMRRGELCRDHQAQHAAGGARAEAFPERDVVGDRQGNLRPRALHNAVEAAEDLVFETSVRGHVATRLKRNRKFQRRLDRGAHPEVERQSDRIETGTEVRARRRHRDAKRVGSRVKHERRSWRR